MKTKTITLYSFKELSKEAQEKALEKYRDYNTYNDWYKELLKESHNDLHDYGFEDADIYFSGFYSQGDGASFTASLNWQTYFKRLPKAKQEAWKEYTGEKSICGVIKKQPHFYEHEYTMSVSLDCENGDNVPEEIEDYILEDAREEARAIYKKLKSCYEVLTSDESLKDSFEANELLFTKDGIIETADNE